MTDPRDPLEGPPLGGRYRLVRKLGEGAMGEVYEATNALGKRVAVKVISGDAAASGGDVLARFFQEARASAKLLSRHVVQVLDAGVDRERRMPYLVMELLQGFDLATLLERTGALDPTTAARIALQAARGLGAAHRAGIVHRDVKPANLFLDAGGSGQVVVKICDFGIAKVQGGDPAVRTRTGALFGTPLYLSPEQVRDTKDVDGRTDVWSLGVVLYEMLAGAAPHDRAGSIGDLLASISNSDPPHLQDAAPWVDPELALVAHRALQRDKAGRLSSMDELAEALAAVVGEDERLEHSMLRGVSEERRAVVAPRADLGSIASAASLRDPLLGRTLGERYRLLRLLGRGGMGAVYEAESTVGKRFAVKVILEAGGMRPELRKRFVREARAAAAIESDHVVAVVDADDDAATGIPFLVMELLSGSDLGQILAQVGPLEPVAATRLFLQACRGLAAAHACSVVHRDIKPANILLDATDGGDVIAKIADFGVAKTISTEALSQSTAALTRTGGVVGSPLYMSPEQAKNAKHVDGRSDLWSLCLSMYEALSGRRPWGHCTTIGELILAICTEEITPLGELAPWVDPPLVELVHRGLRRDLAGRWATATDLASALERLCGGSERVTRDMLISVSSERRSLPARASTPMPATLAASPTPAGFAEASTIAGSASSQSTSRPSSRKNLLAPALAAALVLGGVATWALSVHSTSGGTETAADRSPVAATEATPASAFPESSAETPEVPSAAAPTPPPATAVSSAAPRPTAPVAAPARTAAPKPSATAVARSEPPRDPPPATAAAAASAPATPKLQSSW